MQGRKARAKPARSLDLVPRVKIQLETPRGCGRGTACWPLSHSHSRIAGARMACWLRTDQLGLRRSEPIYGLARERVDPHWPRGAHEAVTANGT